MTKTFRCIGALIPAAALAAALGAAGCAGAGNPASPSTAVDINPATVTADTTFCVDEVNRYRATVGLPPFAHSSNIDAFSAQAAQVDGDAHEAHRHFNATNGGNGTATGENEILWWRLADYGSTRTIITKGLAMMWAEGPGGHHYENMRFGYSEMGCGLYVSPTGEVTVSQDFK